ncbi:MAG TPA: hypothetical protein VIH61_10395 [Waddliaceae bacterium]
MSTIDSTKNNVSQPISLPCSNRQARVISSLAIAVLTCIGVVVALVYLNVNHAIWSKVIMASAIVYGIAIVANIVYACIGCGEAGATKEAEDPEDLFHYTPCKAAIQTLATVFSPAVLAGSVVVFPIYLCVQAYRQPPTTSSA